MLLSALYRSRQNFSLSHRTKNGSALFGLFLRPFRRSRNAFGDKFGPKASNKYNSEIKERLSVRLTSQAILRPRSREMFVCLKCVSVWLFTVKNLLFPEIWTFEYVSPKQTHNELVLFLPMWPMDQTKDLFRLRTSIGDRSDPWTREWNLIFA